MNRMNLSNKIRTLEECANEAYLNSIRLELVYSSSPTTRTRTSEAKRFASLVSEINRARFALECLEIEEHLPDFGKMSTSEIWAWTKGGNTFCWTPCAQGEEDLVVLYDHGYYLAVIRYSQEGWVAEATGYRITPKIAKGLSQRFHTVDY